MILYEECKRVDKVRGQQKVVKGKLRDQCMLCEFYEACNSCFFFGSSNAEKEAAIAAMLNDERKNSGIHEPLLTGPIKHYATAADARKASIMRRKGV